MALKKVEKTPTRQDLLAEIVELEKLVEERNALLVQAALCEDTLSAQDAVDRVVEELRTRN